MTEIEYERKVEKFSQAMFKKLLDNRHKGDWSACDYAYLLRRLREETEELRFRLLGLIRSQATTPEQILSEAADVANFAMMIADNAGALK